MVGNVERPVLTAAAEYAAAPLGACRDARRDAQLDVQGHLAHPELQLAGLLLCKRAVFVALIVELQAETVAHCQSSLSSDAVLLRSYT
jgi:hypothetical protein